MYELWKALMQTKSPGEDEKEIYFFRVSSGDEILLWLPSKEEGKNYFFICQQHLKKKGHRWREDFIFTFTSAQS